LLENAYSLDLDCSVLDEVAEEGDRCDRRS